jgi:acetyl-CoA acetyltransferase
MSRCAIIGAGMTPFGKHVDKSLKDLGGAAIADALNDAGIDRQDVEAAFVANALASVVTGQVSIVGQTVLRANGFDRIPVFNIDNACASGGSALHLALAYLQAGFVKTALVLGVEKMYSAQRGLAYRALNGAADAEFVAAQGIDPDKESVFVKAVYPERLKRYAAQHGLDPTTLARISVKNRNHAASNPVAQFRDPISVEQVLASKTITAPLTALMCSPIGDGAAAVILSTRDIPTRGRAVQVLGSAVGMGAAAGTGGSTVELVAKRAYAQAGVGPADIDVAEVHDATAFTELLAYEQLGFCDPGGGVRLVEEGTTSLGGRMPVNTSGGLESRGHPVGATGLGQVVELVSQLREAAGERQVKGARVALAESAGGFTAGDTAAVTVTILGK